MFYFIIVCSLADVLMFSKMLFYIILLTHSSLLTVSFQNLFLAVTISYKRNTNENKLIEKVDSKFC